MALQQEVHMDSSTARLAMDAYLKEQFGKVVSLRQTSVKRSSSGRIWIGALYCVTSKGDVEIGHITVDESGSISEAPSVDDLIEALSRVGSIEGENLLDGSAAAEAAPDDFSDVLGEDAFSLDADDTDVGSEFSEVDMFFQQVDNTDLRSKIVELLSSGTTEELEEARELMPQLLSDPVGRGSVLRQMGELEHRLGNAGLAVEYFNAAAREFADRGDLDSLRYVADIVERIVGEADFAHHSVARILEQTNSKLEPFDQLDRIPAFYGLADEELFAVTGAAELIRVESEQVVLKEGDPAVRAFVIKSGILKVELETPDGTAQLARCCFPGEFVGETSVLEERGATCNASVIAKQPAMLWCFDGEKLRGLTDKYPDLRARVEQARTLHRVDSFFAMNEATGSLDARVRDQLLSCICAIKMVDPGTVLGTEGKLPEEVFLISKGTVEYRFNTGAIRTYEQDAFVGLGDTLHELLLEGELVAKTPCRLLVFDINRLKALAAAAPADVVAVLERLG